MKIGCLGNRIRSNFNLTVAKIKLYGASQMGNRVKLIKLSLAKEGAFCGEQ
jgi:hypothetical protein